MIFPDGHFHTSTGPTTRTMLDIAGGIGTEYSPAREYSIVLIREGRLTNLGESDIPWLSVGMCADLRQASKC